MIRLARAARTSLCIALVSSSGLALAQKPQKAQTPMTAAPPGASTDRTEEAKALFAAGRSAFEAGRYQDALGHFERCYEISQRAALLYNIGITHDRMRDDDRALEYYDKYLAAVPAAENRAEVETRAAAIRAAIERRKSNAAAAAPAPTAADAAATVAPASEPWNASTEQPPDDRDGGGLLSQWWFWTAVGVVVVGGVTAGVLVATSGDEKAEPRAPKTGVIVTTLGVQR